LSDHLQEKYFCKLLNFVIENSCKNWIREFQEKSNNKKIPFQPTLKSPTKTFFKVFFANTPLGATLIKMSTAKFIPEGLKPQECERDGRIKLPIAYIPEKDTVEGQGRTLKIKVSEDMHLTVPIFHQGTPEQFLSDVQMVLETIHQCKLDKAYQDDCKEDKEAEKKLVKATAAKDSYRGMDENPFRC
jgi:hypothetical protein